MTIPAVYLITIGVAVGIALFAFFAQQQQHRPHRNKSFDQDFVDDSENCTICFEEIRSDLTYLDCGHAFHRQCVSKWLRIRDTCPNCKKTQVTAM